MTPEPIPDDVVVLLLTASQHEQLLPLVRKQQSTRHGLLLISVAPFFDAGQTRLRMQAKLISQPQITKLLKLLNPNETKSNQDCI